MSGGSGRSVLHASRRCQSELTEVSFPAAIVASLMGSTRFDAAGTPHYPNLNAGDHVVHEIATELIRDKEFHRCRLFTSVEEVLDALSTIGTADDSLPYGIVSTNRELTAYERGESVLI